MEHDHMQSDNEHLQFLEESHETLIEILLAEINE